MRGRARDRHPQPGARWRDLLPVRPARAAAGPCSVRWTVRNARTDGTLRRDDARLRGQASHSLVRAELLRRRDRRGSRRATAGDGGGAAARRWRATRIEGTVEEVLVIRAVCHRVDRLERARSAPELMSMPTRAPPPPRTPTTSARRPRPNGAIVAWRSGSSWSPWSRSWQRSCGSPARRARPTSPWRCRRWRDPCETPCETIEPRVTVDVDTARGRRRPTGYRLLRDGAPLDAALDALELTFVDDACHDGRALRLSGHRPERRRRLAAHRAGRGDAADPTRRAPRTSMGCTTCRSRCARHDRSERRSASRTRSPANAAPTGGRSRRPAAPDEGACPSKWTGLEGDIVAAWTAGGKAGSRGCRHGAVATDARRRRSTCPSGRSTSRWSTASGSWPDSGARRRCRSGAPDSRPPRPRSRSPAPADPAPSVRHHLVRVREPHDRRAGSPRPSSTSIPTGRSPWRPCGRRPRRARGSACGSHGRSTAGPRPARW